MNDETLFTLADRLGITRAYVGLDGQQRVTSPEIARAFIEGMGYEASAEALARLDQERWAPGVHGVAVLRPGRTGTVAWTVPHHGYDSPQRWRIRTEAGETVHEGEVHADECPIEEQGQYDDRRAFTVPALDAGYYVLELAGTEALLVCAPEEAHRPPELDQRRMWGPAIQLYAVRSERNWGVGDFRDLDAIIRHFAPLGADFVGLNPLHSLFPDNPAQASPYGPSSRSWLNPLYVAVEDVAEVQTSARARDAMNAVEFRKRLEALRSTEFVDYRGVADAKDAILRLAFDDFDRDSERYRRFETWARDPALKRQATWEALQLRFAAEEKYGFFNWPEEYHEPGGEAVAAFVRDHADEVAYRAYLQWIAAEQLAAASAVTEEVGMAIGLYTDLAVGVAGDSAERWARPHLYGAGASVGAPPDDFNLMGQDWGMPPPIPHAMVDDWLRSFREVLHSTMATSGAVRIDHVMALRRLYWVPHGRPASEGAYVLYPFEAMMAVVTLESRTEECLVVGEDLGVVPPEVTEALRRSRCYSYRILFFEQKGPGLYKAPSELLKESITVPSTHDLPTLRGFWEERDLEVRDELALWPRKEMREQFRAERAAQRQGLLDALARAGLSEEGLSERDFTTLPQHLADAMLLYVAQGQNELMAIQLEDVMGQKEQVNLPGTVDEHPNWNRKLPRTLEELFADDSRNALFDEIRAARRA